ncbi:MAG: PH domain-containing protein [Candidatus Poribacteria bacterium]|nr:PH domain-containing protein [Candidatus Poribacteria bacterium]
MTANEQVQLCMLGRSELLSPDFIIITSDRVLVLDERQMGSLSASYINIRCNLPFSQIKSAKLDRSFKHRVFGQAYLEIQVNGDKYLINNINRREAQRALELIFSQIAPFRSRRRRCKDHKS